MPLPAIALLLMLQPVAPPAPAPAPARIADVAAAAGLPPLDGDAFRFTDLAPGGTVATLFDARRTAAGAERTIVTLSATGGAWRVDTRETKRLAMESFGYLSGRIAAAVAAPAGRAAGPCPDGSDYLAERAAAGRVAAIGGCGDGHPNVALARAFGVRENP